MLRKAILFALLMVIAAPSAANATTGSISGYIHDDNPPFFWSPVQRICAEAYTMPAAGPAVLAGSALSDVDGFYSISGLMPGPHKLFFKECGQEGGVIWGRDVYESQWYDGASSYAEATAIVVVTQATADVTMHHKGWVRGQITDGAGAPVPNACVRLRPDGSEYFWTDNDGRYEIAWVPRGTYVGAIEDCGTASVLGWIGGSSQETASAIEVRTEQDTVADGVLGVTALAGTVRDVHGIPVNPVCVRATDEAGTVLADTRTFRGGYLLRLPGPDNYRVQFEDCEANGYRGEWYDDSPTRQRSKLLRVRYAGVTAGIDADLAPLA